jgi:hypothetical protein
MKSVKTNLIKAKKLISDPKKWTQGWYAKNNHGQYTWPAHEDAVCFCSIGAVIKIDGRPPYANAVEREAKLLDAAARKLNFGSYIELNETSDHRTVMKMFDLAIEATS